MKSGQEEERVKEKTVRLDLGEGGRIYGWMDGSVHRSPAGVA